MARTRLFLFLLLLSSSPLSSASTTVSSSPSREQEEDRIEALPGQPKVGFSQFSGYVTVNESHGRSLFYWLTESPSSPHTKPLLLWLNGGPGCSSIAYGATEEIGPFRINRGHYVPQLAKKINEYNKAFNKPTINIKGFMVGNPDMDKNNDKLGTITYWWSHAMISDTTYNLILRNCNFTADSFSKECNSSIYNAAADFGEIDQYSIYTPKCVRMNQLRKAVLARQTTEYDPCTESYADIYYNRPDVQRAMHANQTAIPYKWTACSDPVFNNWNWRPSDNSMLPIYKELMEAGLRIWVYRLGDSSDSDSVFPQQTQSSSKNSLVPLVLREPVYAYGDEPVILHA
ncbi:hypothetical protein Bca4012_010019 [Brassica carinata]